jgi:hypothetical protein
MVETPGQRAKALVQAADVEFHRGQIESARTKLKEAFDLKGKVEEYSGSEWKQNHHDFTAAMLDMSVLWYKLGKFKEGDALASRAQAWADDPNCSSQRNFERSFSVRENKMKHFRSGWFGWLRAALPV